LMKDVLMTPEALIKYYRLRLIVLNA